LKIAGRLAIRIRAKIWPEVTYMMSPEERVRILREAEPNTWIAFSQDESHVVGQGNTYAEAVAEAKEKGEIDPVILMTPDDWSPKALCPCV
jgi:hypothetical protein